MQFGVFHSDQEWATQFNRFTGLNLWWSMQPAPCRPVQLVRGWSLLKPSPWYPKLGHRVDHHEQTCIGQRTLERVEERVLDIFASSLPGLPAWLPSCAALMPQQTSTSGQALKLLLRSWGCSGIMDPSSNHSIKVAGWAGQSDSCK